VLLLAHADPHGRGDCEPMGIKLRLIPGFKEGIKKIENALNELHESGLILDYAVDRKRYYQISQWDRFQNFNVKNRGEISKFPNPPNFTVNHSESLIFTKKDPELEQETEEEKELEMEHENHMKVYDFWQNQPNLISHRKFAGAFKKRVISAIRGRIEEGYEIKDILKAIENYAVVLSNSSQFFKHKWPLDIFLSQRNAFPVFRDEAEPWNQWKNTKSVANYETTEEYNRKVFEKFKINHSENVVDITPEKNEAGLSIKKSDILNI